MKDLTKHLNEGDVIFLTKRDWKWYEIWDYRGFLSTAIAYVTKKKMDINKVPVHTAIVYKNDGDMRVSEMESKGTVNWSLKDYIDKYRDRITIGLNPYGSSEAQKAAFNSLVHNKVYEYDYNNLLFYQLIKGITKKFIGKDTNNAHICSEYYARMYNVLTEMEYFKNPDSLSPKNIWDLTCEWKKIKLK